MYDNSSVCIYYMRYLTRAGTYIYIDLSRSRTLSGNPISLLPLLS